MKRTTKYEHIRNQKEALNDTNIYNTLYIYIHLMLLSNRFLTYNMNLQTEQDYLNIYIYE